MSTYMTGKSDVKKCNCIQETSCMLRVCGDLVVSRLGLRAPATSGLSSRNTGMFCQNNLGIPKEDS